MNSLNQILKKLEIDFAQTVFVYYGSSSGISGFSIKPKDFITYAKEDFESGNEKGLVNGITNCKRAIDCQIDSILNHFGISFDKIPKASEEIIAKTNTRENETSYKLKLIQSLKFAPSGLIGKARKLRNKLEHYYQIPDRNEIEEAIELAELFVLSCESKIKDCNDEFAISSNNYKYSAPHKNIPEYIEELYSNQLKISFEYDEKRICISPIVNKKLMTSIYIDQHWPEFYFFIRLINSTDYETDCLENLKLLLKFVKYPINENNMKIVELY